MALSENVEVFVVYVTFQSLSFKMTIHLAQKAQIVLLVAKKIAIPAEYSNFAVVFSQKLVIELFE